MKGKRARIVVCILTFAGLLLVWTLATAGDLEPNVPPAPTMKTLDEIYDAVIDISQREGYIDHFNLPADSNIVCFTAPAGKQFVLLKVVFRYDSSTWRRQAYLTVDDNFLTGYPYLRSYTNEVYFTQSFADFPDRCVVVNADEVLKVVNDESCALNAMIVGYFYDVP